MSPPFLMPPDAATLMLFIAMRAMLMLLICYDAAILLLLLHMMPCHAMPLFRFYAPLMPMPLPRYDATPDVAAYAAAAYAMPC